MFALMLYAALDGVCLLGAACTASSRNSRINYDATFRPLDSTSTKLGGSAAYLPPVLSILSRSGLSRDTRSFLVIALPPESAATSASSLLARASLCFTESFDSWSGSSSWCKNAIMSSFTEKPLY